MTRILAVEENDVTRRLLSATLRSAGHEVIEAASAEAALAAAGRSMPELALLATFVSDMPAADLRRDLRALPGGDRLRLIAVAGTLGDAPLEGFDAVVVKPLDPATLLRAVEAQLDPAARTAALGRGRRLLLVDDEPAQRRLGAIAFARAGFAVRTAADGIEALTVARLFRPQAVLCDVLMPRLDGFATCAALRLDPELASAPVLLASSHFVEAEDARVASEAGATALLQRTPDVSRLVRAVADALDGETPPPPADPRAFDADRARRVERQLERLAAINGALAQRAELHRVMLNGIGAIARSVESGDAPADALHALLDAAGIPTGAVYLRGPDGRLLRAAACGLSADELRRLDVSMDEPGARYDVLVRDEALLLDVARRTLVAVQIQGQAEPLGILALGCECDVHDPEHVAFARRAGQAIGGAMTMSRLVDELAASERRYRTLVDNAHDAIVVADTDGVILEVNRGAEELYGAPRESLVGQSFADFAPPGRAESDLQEIRDVIAGTGRFKVMGASMRRADGSTIFADWNVRRVELGEETLVLAVGRDATDRQRREEETRLLHEVSLAASEADDLPAALQIVLERICAVTAWDFGTAWLPDDKDGQLRLRSAWAQPHHLARWRPLLPASFARGLGLLGRALEQGLANWSADAQVDPRVAHVKNLHEMGLHAILTVPAMVRGEVAAVLQFCSTARRDEEPHVISLVSAMAAQVASIIRRKRAEEALRESEAQLRQAQKMEALGRLTGGIAHDFNNLLTVIATNAHMLIEQLAEGDPRRVDAKEIKLATDRAAALTRQLLAFSRRQMLEPKVISPAAIVSGMEKMLRRVIGEHIRFSAIPDADAGAVFTDPGQLEQVLMNLVVNACDAMPNGGELRIRTRNTDAQGSRDVKPGSYVVISVSDSGSGMDEETRRHLFEPFFTTKEKGRGTGLGLSTCYGIVQQSDGAITVESAPGKGSTFRIWLPRVERAAEAAPARSSPSKGGSETILVVEDDEVLRRILQRTLASQGYSVLLARDGAEALATYAMGSRPIDLIVSDVVMPALSGPEMTERLRQLGVETPVLFMSGYVDPTVPGSAQVGPGHNYIQKPFAPEALARRVREVLDKEAA